MIRRNFYTGLFLLLAGGLLLTAYLYSSLTHFSRNVDTYYADATEIAGLEEGTDVEMGGYKLGAIKRIKVRHDPGLRFELELALRKDVPILKGTKAVAASRSLTGGRFLDLRSPSDGRALMEPGSHFQVETEPALQDILNKADAAFGNLAQITAELRQFFASDDNRAGLGETFARLNRVLADVDTAVKTANRLIEGVDRATQQLAPSLASSAQALAGTMQSAESAANRLDSLLEKQEPALAELLKQGNARLAEMKALSSLLAGYDFEKNQSIRATLENLNGASKNLEELLADLKRHPWKLIRKGKEDPLPAVLSPAPTPTLPSPNAPSGDQ